MAEAAKKPKKIKVLSEETKKRKRESNKLNARTSPTFTRWRGAHGKWSVPSGKALPLLSTGVANLHKS